jgi:hypothetical protein
MKKMARFGYNTKRKEKKKKKKLQTKQGSLTVV